MPLLLFSLRNAFRLNFFHGEYQYRLEIHVTNYVVVVVDTVVSKNALQHCNTKNPDIKRQLASCSCCCF